MQGNSKFHVKTETKLFVISGLLEIQDANIYNGFCSRRFELKLLIYFVTENKNF